MNFKKAKWIVPKELKTLTPVQVYHKENVRVRVELPEDLQNLHLAYRRIFRMNDCGKVTLRITADDSYHFYCNGRLVGMGPAQGYPFDYYWNEYDLTPFLRIGENELFADVYYHGRISRSFASGDRRVGLLAELFDPAGNTLEYTGTHWQCGRIPAYGAAATLGYDTAFTENYDSRAELPDYRPAAEIQSDRVLHLTPTGTLSLSERRPVKNEALPDGGIFCDFGEELTGHLSLTAQGHAGDTVRILHGEETEDTPLRVRYRMRCNCLCDETWTLREGENQRTQYDYKAFRYVTLCPSPGVQIKEIRVLVRHWPFDWDYCRLETEDERLLKIFQICKNAVRCGAQETFVDCPMREKGQYAGDLTVTSHAHLLLTGDPALLRKAIDNQMASAFVCPGLLAVTPGSFMQEIADYSLQFPILALHYYRFTGDRAYLAENLAVCEGVLSHFSAFAGADGLLRGVTDKWNLVDWPEKLRDGYDFRLTRPVAADSPAHNVLNAFYIGAVLLTEEIRSILGVAREKESGRLIAAFHRAFYDPEKGLYRDSEVSAHTALHSNILPLYFGFCQAADPDKVADFLLGRGLCCGVYMAYFFLGALCRIGRYEDAYRLIVGEGEHSWLRMVREGATATFEAWGKDEKQNTSLCHPWAAAPVVYLVRDILPALPRLGRVVYRKKEQNEGKAK